MKVKDIPSELAEAVCRKTREKYKEIDGNACKNCPLQIPNLYMCFKTIAHLNEKYGNKEVKVND